MDCGSGVVYSTAPSDARSCDLGMASGEVRYDLIEGTWSASSAGSELGGSGHLETSDDFHVIGLPDGTPLVLLAELALRGSVSGGCGYAQPGGSVGGRLREGAANEQSASAGPRGGARRGVGLPRRGGGGGAPPPAGAIEETRGRGVRPPSLPGAPPARG